MRGPRQGVKGLLATAVALVCAAAPALACTCVVPATPPEPVVAVGEALAHSSAVLLGVVLDVDGPYLIPTGHDCYRKSDRGFRMQGLASWKGAQPDTVTVLSDDSCGFDFVIGELYLVYAEGPVRADSVRTDICTRTRRWLDAAADSVVLGRPAVDRTPGRVWRSYRPSLNCPVHHGALVQLASTGIVFGLPNQARIVYEELRSGRFPYAGLQVDRPPTIADDPQGTDARGLSRAFVCSICRQQACEWCREHGGRCTPE
jgi:hypothetical protein